MASFFERLFRRNPARQDMAQLAADMEESQIPTPAEIAASERIKGQKGKRYEIDATMPDTPEPAPDVIRKGKRFEIAESPMTEISAERLAAKAKVRFAEDRRNPKVEKNAKPKVDYTKDVEANTQPLEEVVSVSKEWRKERKREAMKLEPADLIKEFNTKVDSLPISYLTKRSMKGSAADIASSINELDKAQAKLESYKDRMDTLSNKASDYQRHYVDTRIKEQLDEFRNGLQAKREQEARDLAKAQIKRYQKSLDGVKGDSPQAKQYAAILKNRITALKEEVLDPKVTSPSAVLYGARGELRERLGAKDFSILSSEFDAIYTKQIEDKKIDLKREYGRKSQGELYKEQQAMVKELNSERLALHQKAEKLTPKIEAMKANMKVTRKEAMERLQNSLVFVDALSTISTEINLRSKDMEKVVQGKATLELPGEAFKGLSGLAGNKTVLNGIELRESEDGIDLRVVDKKKVTKPEQVVETSGGFFSTLLDKIRGLFNRKTKEAMAGMAEVDKDLRTNTKPFSKDAFVTAEERAEEQARLKKEQREKSEHRAELASESRSLGIPQRPGLIDRIRGKKAQTSDEIAADDPLIQPIAGGWKSIIPDKTAPVKGSGKYHEAEDAHQKPSSKPSIKRSGSFSEGVTANEGDKGRGGR